MLIDHRISSFLNFVRWISASIVMLTHLRNHVFVSYELVQNQNSVVTKLFYFFTQFGDEAVMIFFVLSGFFIGGGILSKASKEKFFFKEYLIDRIARLYVVLIPALALTAIIGFFLTTYSMIEIKALTLTDFIGNLFFLQTIYVSEYGNNSPLWSLSYEMFYYLLFPLSFFVYKGIYRYWSILLIIFLTAIATKEILIYSSVWLLGVILWKLQRRVIPISLSLIIFIGMLVIRRLDLFDFGSKYMEDILFSGSFFLLANSFIFTERLTFLNKIEKVNEKFANFSYTLYLIHLPLILLLLHFIDIFKLDFSFVGYQQLGFFFFFASIIYFISYLFSLLTEQYTGHVKNTIKQILKR